MAPALTIVIGESFGSRRLGGQPTIAQARAKAATIVRATATATAAVSIMAYGIRKPAVAGARFSSPASSLLAGRLVLSTTCLVSPGGSGAARGEEAPQPMCYMQAAAATATPRGALGPSQLGHRSTSSRIFALDRQILRWPHVMNDACGRRTLPVLPLLV